MAPSISVRRMDIDPATELPIWWFYDSAFISHRANALHLLFPAGERFFIRSVRHYADQIDDPALAARVRAFAGQEAQHGRTHEQAFALLEAQGFELRAFLAWYEHLAYDVLEQRVPPILRLATTAALEHFTATLATQALTDGYLDHAHPVMRTMLRWHAAEEIEHKDVAFDVFDSVGGGYGMRMLGLAVAAGGLMYFWNRGTNHLIRQDARCTRKQIRREFKEALARGQNRGFLKEGILSYMRPGFHPNHIDNRGLAADFLAGLGLPATGVTA